MVADSRFQLVVPLRESLAFMLLPAQRALQVPVQMWQGGADYLRGLRQAQVSEREAQVRMAQVAERALRTEQLASENAALRALLDLRPALQVRSIPAEVMFEAADPFSRKLFIDRGTQQGVLAGAPVINAEGVLGQVTRAYALHAEVTLLTDKDAAIPVLNLRTQQRSAAFGFSGGLELRYVSGQADVKVGDELHTSGLDGVYPPGLAVARVVDVQRRQDSGFARIMLKPTAAGDTARHVLVLEPVGLQLPARPAVGPAAAPESAAGERQLTTPRRAVSSSKPGLWRPR
jgi:rod shape-determining protein MreC